jgi:hypothetical protein
VGLLLSLAWLQLVGMATAMLSQIVAESLYTRARKIGLAVVMVTAFAGLGQAIRGPISFGSTAELAETLRASGPIRVLVAPFEVFTHAMFAEAWFPGLFAWASAALAMDLALLFLILKLDADYLELAATVSQKVYEQLRRTKLGGGIAMPVSSRSPWIRLPHPLWLAGVGPVAWRQILLAIRTSRHMIIMSLALAAVFVVITAFSGPGPSEARIAGPKPADAAIAPGLGIAMTAYLTFLFSMQLPWAFRGDLDHIDFLKTLPLHPMILTVGELAGGTLLLTLLQLAILTLFIVAAPAGALMMIMAAAFAAPFNVLILGLNNLLFLIYPVRLVAGTTFDFQSFGRMMIFLLIQFLLLIPLFGIPAGVGGLVCLVAGFSWPVFALTAWLVLVAELLPVVILVAWAFQQYDPSIQTPA